MTKETARETIKAELTPGEELLWAGAPKPGPDWYRGCVFMYPVLMLCILYYAHELRPLWRFGVVALPPSSDPDYPVAVSWVGTALAILGMSIVGTVCIAWLPLHVARERARTAYGVTSRRLMIVSPKGVTSHPLSDLPEVGWQERADGYGDVTFEHPDLPPLSWTRRLVEPLPRRYPFERISGTPHVHNLIVQAKRKAMEMPAPVHGGDPQPQSSRTT